jgi:hypothetical protein
MSRGRGQQGRRDPDPPGPALPHAHLDMTLSRVLPVFPSVTRRACVHYGQYAARRRAPLRDVSSSCRWSMVPRQCAGRSRVAQTRMPAIPENHAQPVLDRSAGAPEASTLRRAVRTLGPQRVELTLTAARSCRDRSQQGVTTRFVQNRTLGLPRAGGPVATELKVRFRPAQSSPNGHF